MHIDASQFYNYNIHREKSATHRLCHAPFSSLRFAHTGNVQACCFNRKYILGNVATDTLKQIWFGPKIQQLRDSIIRGNLSLGCNRCYQEITEGNYWGCAARNYDYVALPTEATYPTMLDFEIGNTCNYECVMCNGEYSSTIRQFREKAKPYPKVYGQEFVEQLEEFIPHVRETRFVGGEPFMVDVHYPIWDMIVDSNPAAKITILTNGSILNQRILDLYKKGNLHVSFSIDSLQREVYKQIRKRGDFDSVMENFHSVYNLSKLYSRDINVNVCFMRQNALEMPDFVKFCNKKNVPLIFHIVNYPFHCSLWNYNKGELKKILDYFDSIVFDSPQTFTSDKNIHQFNALKMQLAIWFNKKSEQEKFREYFLARTVHDLKVDLNNKLISYYESTGDYGHSENQAFTQRLFRVYSQFSEQQLHRTLVELLLIPIEIIAGEFVNISDERLFQKLKFAIAVEDL